MTAAVTSSLAKSVAGVIKEHTQRAFTALRQLMEQRFEAQDRVIAELKTELEAVRAKSNPADWYRGTWKHDEHYARGESVTDRGACWMCISATSARPGSTADWRLTEKGDAR